MKESAKYLANLAQQLEKLGVNIAGCELESLSAADMEKLLAHIRDVFGHVEQGLNIVAGELEDRCVDLH